MWYCSCVQFFNGVVIIFKFVVWVVVFVIVRMKIDIENIGVLFVRDFIFFSVFLFFVWWGFVVESDVIFICYCFIDSIYFMGIWRYFWKFIVW